MNIIYRHNLSKNNTLDLQFSSFQLSTEGAFTDVLYKIESPFYEFSMYSYISGHRKLI